MEKITKSDSCSSSNPIRRRFKHRITRMLLLHSTCTITAAAAAAAGDLVKLSKCTLPKQKLIGYSKQEPFLPRARRPEDKTRKKERRLTEVGDLYVTGEGEGRKCPPASPSSPTRNCCRHCSRQAGDKKKKSYGRGKETRKFPVNNAYRISRSSSSDCNDELGLYSSSEEEDDDDDDESGTLFSPRILSSDSSDFYCSNRKKKTTKTTKTTKKKRKSIKLASFSTASMKEKVEAEWSAGFAVVKNSSDPYMDFLSSMAEMILELQVSCVSDMEKLLDSYLDLNSTLLHPLILEAFVDVWEALSLDDRFDSISLCS